MDLQSILRETRQLTDGVLIARLTNGFDLAYEKQLENEFHVFENKNSNCEERRNLGSRTTVKYALLPAQRRGITSGHNAQEIQTNKPGSFSPQARTSIDVYISKRELDIEDFREAAKQLFEEFIAPLGITEFRYRDWKEYGRVSLMVFGWPILLPQYLISGHKHDYSGDGGLAVLTAPFLLPHLARELVAPNEFLRRAYRAKGIDGVLHEETRGDDSAILFHPDGNPKKFSRVEIIFPNGMTLTNYGLFTCPNQEYVMGEYNRAKFFLHSDKELNKRAYDLNEREKSENNRWVEFYERLRESDSDHEGLLNSVGFLP